jgi:hypothetical protein
MRPLNNVPLQPRIAEIEEDEDDLNDFLHDSADV